MTDRPYTVSSGTGGSVAYLFLKWSSVFGSWIWGASRKGESMDWQPITTIPQNEPVQLARFPALAGEEPAQWFGCSMVTGEDAKRLDGLNGATHWRKLSVTVSET